MRHWIDLVEKIVYRDTKRYDSHSWMNTVVAINPTKSEFWSANFRQAKEGLEPKPSAVGVILKDGTVVVGTGHTLAHDTICDHAGLSISDELFRLQIWDGMVKVELWLPEGNGDGEVMNDSPLEEKIAAVKIMTGMTVDEVKAYVASVTNRFVPNWKVSCLLWTEYAESVEV